MATDQPRRAHGGVRVRTANICRCILKNLSSFFATVVACWVSMCFHLIHVDNKAHMQAVSKVRILYGYACIGERPRLGQSPWKNLGATLVARSLKIYCFLYAAHLTTKKFIKDRNAPSHLGRSDTYIIFLNIIGGFFSMK